MGRRSDPGARMWWAGDLGGLELFRATLSSFAFQPHAHEEFFVAVTEADVVTPTYRGAGHVAAAGDVIVLNPEEAHAGGPPAGLSWAYRALYPGPDLMRGIRAEFPGSRAPTPVFGGDVVHDRQVAAALSRYHRLTESPESGPLERETRLVEALALLVGRHAAGTGRPRPPRHEPAAVRISRAYLEAHATAPVTLRTLTDHAGLSVFHLCRVFHAAVGMTPHAYQTQLRVRHAKNLLHAGHPIAEAATAAGFYDQAHLNRHFKRILGVTPGRYARLRSRRSPPSPPP